MDPAATEPAAPVPEIDDWGIGLFFSRYFLYFDHERSKLASNVIFFKKKLMSE
jgi:hypothetical protein